MSKVKNVPVSVIIKKILEESKDSLSTYEIAKKTNLSWSTVNIHCYKLKDQDVLNCKVKMAEVGSGKKILWFLKKAQNSK